MIDVFLRLIVAEKLFKNQLNQFAGRSHRGVFTQSERSAREGVLTIFSLLIPLFLLILCFFVEL